MKLTYYYNPGDRSTTWFLFVSNGYYTYYHVPSKTTSNYTGEVHHLEGTNIELLNYE